MDPNDIRGPETSAAVADRSRAGLPRSWSACLAYAAIAILLVVVGGRLARADVDLSLQPDVVRANTGEVVRLSLIATASSGVDESIAAMDVILQWDPSVLELIGKIDDGSYSWLVSGFLDDSGLDGLNDTFEDGDALYTALAQFAPDPPAYATQTGLVVTTFEFRALAPGMTAVEAMASAGARTRTVVYDGFVPGLEVTGSLLGADASVVLGCVPGTVNAAAGPIANVLFVNGSAGDGAGRVAVREGEALWAVILQPPARLKGKWVVTANEGHPSASTELLLPANVGAFCFPLLLSDGATSAAVWNGIGKERKVGAGRYFDGTPIPRLGRASIVFLELWNGDPVYLPLGTRLTLQGVIFDGASLGSKPASATNAILLEIE